MIGRIFPFPSLRAAGEAIQKWLNVRQIGPLFKNTGLLRASPRNDARPLPPLRAAGNCYLFDASIFFLLGLCAFLPLWQKIV
jgi:hypothetical protein